MRRPILAAVIAIAAFFPAALSAQTSPPTVTGPSPAPTRPWVHPTGSPWPHGMAAPAQIGERHDLLPREEVREREWRHREDVRRYFEERRREREFRHARWDRR